MKKGTRLKGLSKITAVLLIISLSTNSFAAIVSDNDGSAFITKAEFDSLKSDFQAQIDNYNTSIDNKIDGAISAYLAGIRVSQKMSGNFYYPVANKKPVIISASPSALNRVETYQMEEAIHVNVLRSDANFGAELNPVPAVSWSRTARAEQPWAYFAIGTGRSTNDGCGSGFETQKDSPDVVEAFYRDAYLSMVGGFSLSALSVTGAQCYLCLLEFGGNNDSRTINTSLSSIVQHSGTYGRTYEINDNSYRNDEGLDMFEKGKYDYSFIYDPLFYISHVKRDKDENIYIFNYCDCDNIISWNAEDTIFTEFQDTVKTPFPDEIKTNTALSSGTVVLNSYLASMPKQLLVRTNKLVLYQKAYYDKYGKYVTNLNQLKNGLIKYTVDDSTKYPYFYSGLPLFTLTESKSVIASFKMQLKSIVGNKKVRVWIKEGDFNNNSTPSTQDLNACVVVNISGKKDNKNKYIDLDVGKKYKLEFSAGKDKTYFMKWSELTEDGTVVGYGGQIETLNELYYEDTD